MSRVLLSSALVLCGCVQPMVEKPAAPNVADGGAATAVDGGTRRADDGGFRTTADAGALQAQDAGASVNVDFTSDSGSVPELFRLGVQVNGATDEVNRALLTEHKLGHVRLDLGYAVLSPATSLADAVARVKQVNARMQIEALRAMGAEVTLNLVETPRYLSSCSERTELEPISGWPVFSTCPPSDLEQWTALIAAIVTEVGTGPSWEVWNEPDGSFWRGTPAEFFELYAATVRGVRRADPTARVGGPTVSNPWAGTEPGSATKGFIEAWLAYCSSHGIPELGLTRTPVDFVVWHQFGLLPAGSSKAIHDVRQWATAAGYPSVALSVDEWNVQTESNAPSWLDDAFHPDSEFGAAWAVRQLLEMHRAGLNRHAFSALSDWSSGSEFHGGQGLATRSGLRKPVWNAMRLLGELHGELGALTVLGDARFLDGAASLASDSAWVVVVNSVPDFRFALQQLVAFEHTRDRALVAEIDALPEALKRALLVDFTMTGSQLPLSAAAQTLADVLAARSRQVFSAQGPVTARISMKGVPASFTRLRRFVVDSKTSNSFRAWEAAGGSTTDVSLSKAQAAMGLTMVEDSTWTGGALTATFERSSVVAIQLSAP